MPIFSFIFILFFTSLWKSSFTLKCYECSGHVSCGKGDTSQLVNCAGKCMVYRNQYDGGNIIRRCCPSDCGSEDGLRTFEGRDPVYFCSQDECNGETADGNLASGGSATSPNGLTTTTGPGKSNDLYSCYDCSGHNPSCGTGDNVIIHQCQACMVYLNQYDGNTVIRRCCQSGCGPSDSISEYEGRQAYVCRSNRCNGQGTEERLKGGSGGSTIPSTSSMRTPSTTMPPSSITCYDCSGTERSVCTSTMPKCPMCMIFRSDHDPKKFDRKCCWWGCGSPGQVSQFNGRPTYFCNTDRCNGPGQEQLLIGTTSTTSTTIVTTTIVTTSTSRPASFRCYSCSGSECGREDSPLSSECPSCMVYYNHNTIERRCCWWACGPSNTVTDYNGNPTYFCSSDKCNGVGSENILPPPKITTAVTTTTSTSTTTTYSSATCRLNCQNGSTAETEDGCFCYCVENTSGRECEQIDCSAGADVDTDVCNGENQPLCAESDIFSYECLHLCGKC